MIDRDKLGELICSLTEAQVSQEGRAIAETLIRRITEIDPTKGVPSNIRKRLNDKDLIPSGAVSSINLIPSDIRGKCHELLVTICAGEDELDHYTIDTLALCINCYRRLRAVIIITGFWQEDDFNEWRKPPFQALHNQFGIEFFIVTPVAGTWMIVPMSF